MSEPDSPPQPASKRTPLASLTLAALGVVYGDIGTSPLYAIKECFGSHGVPPTEHNIFGVMSLIFWSLGFVISFKYIAVLLKADNRGEGGILALLALVRPRGEATGATLMLILLGIFGTALLYGDGVITPAISVLGAVDGLKVASPAFAQLVVPLSFVILFLLFLSQRLGTAGVGQVFGPIMIVWFLSIAALGIMGIARDPSVLLAVNPYYAVRFFMEDRLQGFLILGAVVLVITGGEALYADMGHFGRRPIRIAWFGMALPALLLNYFGQAALLLHQPAAASSPFFQLVPSGLLYPMIVVATLAAIVASQALISGAFSLTRQAVQLGYFPRVTIKHTSHREEGQIYVPEVNWGLMVLCLWLVVTFRSADALAGAYGIAVTGTMSITTVLFGNVARVRWRWPWWRVLLVTGAFLLVDLSFLAANVVKIPEGGWVPIVLGLVVFTLLTTWKQGRAILTAVLRETSIPIDLFIQDLARRKPPRVPGTAVFMTSDPSGAPPVLLHHLKHNKVLHQTVILMSVVTEDVPTVDEAERVELEALGEGFYKVVAYYGFMESPNVPLVLHSLHQRGLDVRPMETSFYLGRETLIPTSASRAKRQVLRSKGQWMAMWRKKLFVVMTNNARSATAFFNLPPNRVVEMGAQIQI